MNDIRCHTAPRGILSATASVDTIEIFLSRPQEGLRRQIESAAGRRVLIKDCFDRNNNRRGLRAIVNRPALAVVPILRDMVGAKGGAVCRVDFAFDIEMNTEADADTLASWIDHHIVLKWRSSKARKMKYWTTTYWCDARKGRNLVQYRKRRCPHVVRIELRFLRAAAVKRAGLHDLSQLSRTSPKGIFERHIKGRRFTERFEVKVMREAVMQERRRSVRTSDGRGNDAVREFVDRYQSRIPQRVRHLLSQLDAQSMGIRGTEDIDLEFLKIPDRLTWPSLGMRHTRPPQP